LDHELDTNGLSALQGLLDEWLRSCLDELSTDVALDKASLEPDDLIRMIRSLWMLYDDRPDSLPTSCLYQAVISCFSVLAVHRYSCMVLLPLVTALEKELVGKRSYLKPLASLMIDIMESWIKYCVLTVPKDLKVSSIASFISVILK
jgi:hypothetical protein